MKAYLAGPFFNDEQRHVIDLIQSLCDKNNILTYNPKEVIVFKPGEMDPATVFDSNIEAILKCNFVIAITDGKDPGTLFESGYAYCANIPIVYVWLNNEGMKFNLMLKESSVLVCKSLNALDKALCVVYIKDSAESLYSLNDAIDGELE